MEAVVNRGMADVDVRPDEVRPAADDLVVAPDGPPSSRRTPRRPRRTLRSDLGRLVGTPARRARLLITLLVLAAAVTGPLLARASVTDARAEVRAQGAERSGAAEARAATEADVVAAEGARDDAEARAVWAREGHNEQRRRLAALGLNEQTVDAFLVEVNANAELVEYRRDSTTADVDRQAVEIPDMQECVRVASRALNGAWNSATFGDAPPPAPSDLCRALLAAGT